MDYRYIEQLVERYFNGDTTPKEEVILRTFFSQDEIPDTLQPLRAMFQAEALWTSQQPGAGLEAEIMRHIEQPTYRARRITMAWRLRPLYKAVAGVAIVLSLGLAMSQGLTTNDATVTPSGTRQVGEQVSALGLDAAQALPIDSIASGQ